MTCSSETFAQSLEWSNGVKACTSRLVVSCIMTFLGVTVGPVEYNVREKCLTSYEMEVRGSFLGDNCA